ncbi:FAS1 domain-containing protein [Triangularia verruculosa]|uniref:FAS1 domain-containing protein n=1 Tax=Triangularia verruculosa TaxID=2587418 RepID=A0AAN6XLL7_9PEZI|nr:FAS1 domain-containing protein [Triangularia verruculosa]
MLPSTILSVPFLVSPVLGQTLLQALNANNFTLYAQRITNIPSIANAAGPGLVIYAPIDEAIRSVTPNRSNSSSAKRQDEEENPSIEECECGATNDHSQKQKKRQLSVSPGSARTTFLDDPAFVNLGPGRAQSIVERCPPGEIWPKVYAGLGRNVTVVGNDIPFNGGVIRPVDGIITVPGSLSDTARVPSLGVSTFINAAQRAGLLTELDNKTKITVLVPSDDALASASSLSDTELAQVLRRHVLVDVTAYTPLLRQGDVYRTLAGDTVSVTLRDGGYYINGAQIVHGDAIIKNGVLHTIDRLLGPSTTTLPSGTSTSTTIATAPVATGGATSTQISWVALVYTAFVLAIVL